MTADGGGPILIWGAGGVGGTIGAGASADIAHAVRCFASDHAAWITGQVLSVNGGA